VDILIADNDPTLVKMVSFLLIEAGYRVITAYDGQQCLQAISQHQPGLVLLEAILPSISGFEVCQRIRQISDVPIIFLSICMSVKERVTGLEIGADDYVGKPFEPAELLVRIEAVLRRCKDSVASLRAPLRHGDFTLDPSAHQVHVRQSQAIRLTPIEYRLLEYFVIHAGQVLSPRQILEHVWQHYESNDRSVISTYIRRLRNKIEVGLAAPKHIITVRNLGYRFEASSGA
jgi:DNA-binding response OmpR family regulator